MLNLLDIFYVLCDNPFSMDTLNNIDGRKGGSAAYGSREAILDLQGTDMVGLSFLKLRSLHKHNLLKDLSRPRLLTRRER